MARKALIEREKRRMKLIAKYAEKRAQLRAILKDPNVPLEEKMAAQEKLQKLPKDSCPVRLRRRCAITGRPRAVYRKFGLGRNKLRELAMWGDIPGIRKASW